MFSVELLVIEETINNRVEFFVGAQIRGRTIRLAPNALTPEAAVDAYGEALARRLVDCEDRIEDLEDRIAELEAK